MCKKRSVLDKQNTNCIIDQLIKGVYIPLLVLHVQGKSSGIRDKLKITHQNHQDSQFRIASLLGGTSKSHGVEGKEMENLAVKRIFRWEYLTWTTQSTLLTNGQQPFETANWRVIGRRIFSKGQKFILSCLIHAHPANTRACSWTLKADRPVSMFHVFTGTSAPRRSQSITSPSTLEKTSYKIDNEPGKIQTLRTRTAYLKSGANGRSGPTSCVLHTIAL
jgi:hypothetical protein